MLQYFYGRQWQRICHYVIHRRLSAVANLFPLNHRSRSSLAHAFRWFLTLNETNLNRNIQPRRTVYEPRSALSESKPGKLLTRLLVKRGIINQVVTCAQIKRKKNSLNFTIVFWKYWIAGRRSRRSASNGIVRKPRPNRGKWRRNKATHNGRSQTIMI